MKRLLLAVGFAAATVSGTLAGPPAPDPSWERRALAEIAAAEYRFSWKDGDLSAPNRAHGLRARVAPDGFSIVSRTSEEDFRFELRLLGHEPGTLAESDGRAEIRRPSLTERLANDPRGIEHGITVSRAPEGDGPLVLSFALTGDVLAYAEGEAGTSVLFRDGRGEAVVRYAELSAVDARGEHLPARMDLTLGRLTLTVDDAQAVYPVAVDLLAVTPHWEKTGGQAGAQLGNAVSTAGDVDGDGYSDVIVGAYAYDDGEADEGKVFVYRGGPAGLAATVSWTAQANQVGANLGASVATAGDVNSDGYDDVVAGAFGYDSTLADRGAAFLWLGGPSGLGADGTPANADWSALGEQAGSAFGVRVVRAGDVNGDGHDDIAVAAHLDDWLDVDQGRVFAFYGGSSGPSSTYDWFTSPGDGSGAALFGLGLAAAGDVNGDGYDDLLIGAPHYTGTASSEGAAFLYRGSSSGLGSAAWAKLGGQAGAQLGFSVAGVGDVNGDGFADVAVGEPTWDDLFFPDAGQIDLWLGRAGPLPQAPDWQFTSGQSFAQIGFALAAAGDVNGDGFADIVVGSDVWDAGSSDEGKAWLFYGKSGIPAGTPDWTVVGGQGWAYLGDAVGTAGDVNGDGYSDLIVGVYGWDGTGPDEGAVRAYLGSADGPRTTSAWSKTEAQAFSSYGFSVAGAGDVNADGFSDVIVGAHDFDLGATGDGAVFVYHGGAGGLSTSIAQSFGGGQNSGGCGYSVAGAGDVNGDGFADVAFGCPTFSDPQVLEGKTMVCPGSATGVIGPCWNLQANVPNAVLGWSVAGVGDVNGDGAADVMMGAPLGDGTEVDQGLAYIAYGAIPGGPTGLVQIGATSSQPGARFGNAFAGGDFNRDGYADVVIAAEEWGNFTGGHAGKLFLFPGGPGGLAVSASGSFSPEGNAQWRLGRSLACAGDVNGDGHADLVAGVPGRENGQANEGTAYLYVGDAGGLFPFPVWSFESNQADAGLSLESGVGSAGDVNNDGYSDVLVGAPFWDEGTAVAAGRAWLFLGSAGGLSGTAAWSVTGTTSGRLGTSVAAAGDVNGDGYADFLVGEPNHTPGGPGADPVGKAALFLGNGLGGRPRPARQRNFAFTRNIAPQGTVDTDLAFGVAHTMIAPAGSQEQSLEVEPKPLSAALDGTNTVVLGNLGRTMGSRPMSLGIQSLAALTSYRWRIRTQSPHPFFPRSPWFSIADLGVTLTDFRTPCQGIRWYRDADGDGHGTFAQQQFTCVQPAGYVTVGDDCDDTNPARFPGNPEICDSFDNDCNTMADDVPLPLAGTGLALSRTGFTANLAWAVFQGATSYDVVRGGLATLRGFAGDFTPSVNACVVNNGTATAAADPSVPGSGDAWWYVVRGVNCGGAGTYDSGSPRQAGSRDAEIAASGVSCP